MCSKTLSDFEKGWLSGLIDGEGSLRLRERSDSENYKVSVTVSNNSLTLLERIQEIIPASKIYEENRENENWKDSYQLVIWKHEAILNLLNQINDDLIIKQEKAEILIDFIEIRQKSSRSRDKSGRFTSSEANPKEDELFKKFKHL